MAIVQAHRIVHISGHIGKAALENAMAYERKALFGKIGELVTTDQMFTVSFSVRDLTPEEYREYARGVREEDIDKLIKFWHLERDYLKVFTLKLYIRKDLKIDVIDQPTQTPHGLPPQDQQTS